MSGATGWALVAATAACLGLACDTPTPARPRSPLLRRSFPETADLHADSSLDRDRPPVPVSATPGDRRSPAVGASSAEPHGSERVAAVLLMLPDDADDPARPRGTRTYRFSLRDDMAEARIEIGGRDIGPIPVQRVYAQPRPAGPLLAPRGARGAAVPRGSDSVSAPEAATPMSDWTRKQPARRRAAIDVNVAPRTTHARSLYPNGAPIID